MRREAIWHWLVDESDRMREKAWKVSSAVRWRSPVMRVSM